MSLAHLKHKITGEIKKVERGSQEYLDLAAERDPDKPHQPLYEDRGVAGFAEEDVEPVAGNVNDRNYNDPDSFPGAPRDEDDSEVPVLATASEREDHATTPSQHHVSQGADEAPEPEVSGDEAQRKAAQAAAEAEAKRKAASGQ